MTLVPLCLSVGEILERRVLICIRHDGGEIHLDRTSRNDSVIAAQCIYAITLAHFIDALEVTHHTFRQLPPARCSLVRGRE